MSEAQGTKQHAWGRMPVSWQILGQYPARSDLRYIDDHTWPKVGFERPSVDRGALRVVVGGCISMGPNMKSGGDRRKSQMMTKVKVETHSAFEGLVTWKDRSTSANAGRYIENFHNVCPHFNSEV